MSGHARGIKMEIHVSVRQLVEFILREGSIDNRRSGGYDTAMQEGSRIHKMLQKRMGSEYHAEVSLKYIQHVSKTDLNIESYLHDTEQIETHIVEETGYDIILEGRADGIIDYHWGETKRSLAAVSLVETDKVIIDEIKGTYKELKRIVQPVGVHLAQAKCYAFMYAHDNHLDSIGVRMTYCNIETEEVKYFHEDYTKKELESWFDALLTEYIKWTDFQFTWNRLRTTSIKQLSFPFSYREGQKELVTYVYQTIYHRRKLFLEAPTGVGKTISTVFPAVKSMGEGLTEKIFYLTAKTITRTVAQECFGLLQDNGLCMKMAVLTAKDKICPAKQKKEETVTCNPDSCPYAKGHFDRINEAMYDLLTHENHFTREKVTEYAMKYMVCPFEMSLDMSLFSDVIICDYNYVFDPRVYLKRFFADGAGKREYVFLIDEAHNLLERGREMYSAALLKESFLDIKHLMKEDSPKIVTYAERCNKELLIMKRECERYRKEEMIDGFVMALRTLYGAIDDFLDEHDTFLGKEELLEFYFAISHFLNMYEIMDSNYIVYSQLTENGSFMLKLFCVDPSCNLRQCMNKGRSSVLFSATFLPIQYYKKLLGGEPTDYEVYAKSIFQQEKRALLIAKDVTSKYTRRGREEFERIARYIYEMVRQKQGNYMVFLPSHLFLEQVYECFVDLYFDEESMECIVQEDYMSEEKREEFLLCFQGNTHCDLTQNIDFDIEYETQVEGRILIGFCVMGGIFSEGIDLKYDSLIGAVIVGTGIPQIGCERELLKEYFDGQGENGFDYAYRYPGMNKVLQSAGRVIRTVEDIGVIALLDERFLEPSYRRMFPREWNNYTVVCAENIGRQVEQFWNEWM